MTGKPTINHQHYQDHPDLLGQVEKPSRYLGTEINRIIKDPDAVDVRLALAFPDLYEIGTSHFGLQILYHLLNQYGHILAERVFAPARDMENQLRRQGIALTTLESCIPLNQFDIIGFSLLYELNYTNVLNMLDLGRIPLFARDRQLGHPFVIAGGPCVCNPEPMADFFDAMVFGDGEAVLLEMVEAWIAWKKQGCQQREALLRQWSRLDGVYIPQFFNVEYDENGFQHLIPRHGDLTRDYRVQRRIVTDLDAAFFPDRPVIPFGRPVHDRLRLEISRGCTRGCRFCQAGMIYRPVRERSAETLLHLCRSSLASTGYEDLSLLSLSTGDYTCLSSLMENLMTRCREDRIAVSLPSIRAGTLTPRLMQMIRDVRKTGFTIAPEAGSQRLRDVINKNISYEDIAATIEDAFALGWQVIKLYFMIGLPTETPQDIDAIVEMVSRLSRIKGPARRKGRLNISVTSFIPKPHTPFQWAAQITRAESEQILDHLKSRLPKGTGQLKWQHPAMSVLEGVMARGDRRLAAVIMEAWRFGCLFDGWTDQFRFELWEKAFAATGVSSDFFTHRERHLDELLPWQHMASGVSDRFLKEQWQSARSGERLSDCRHEGCHQCGVCDFIAIEPKLFHNCPNPPQDIEKPTEPESNAKLQMELVYCKLGPGRFLGHLETANIFARALRRAGIKVRYSRGFHPMPRISFDDPLPLGMESQAERMRIILKNDIEGDILISRLNAHLPEGLSIISCRRMGKGPSAQAAYSDTYQIFFPAGLLDEKKVDEFLAADRWSHVKKRSKGAPRRLDLKAAVKTIRFIAPLVLEMVLERNDRYVVRPADVLRGVFGIAPIQLARFRVLKMAAGTNVNP